MQYLDSDGRLHLARERAAELARQYEPRKRDPERRTVAAHRDARPRLRLVQGRDGSHESAGA
jgi:hypothetical protein